jgi:hypothetical protein
MKNCLENIKTPLDLPHFGESEMVLFVYIPTENNMFLLGESGQICKLTGKDSN